MHGPRPSSPDGEKAPDESVHSLVQEIASLGASVEKWFNAHDDFIGNFGEGAEAMPSRVG